MEPVHGGVEGHVRLPTVLPGRVDAPFWWRPWLRLYPVVEWWERPRTVSARKYARLAAKGRT